MGSFNQSKCKVWVSTQFFDNKEKLSLSNKKKLYVIPSHRLRSAYACAQYDQSLQPINPLFETHIPNDPE